jgi:hypothetical protein
MRQKSHINWNLPENDTKLRRFRRYLRDNGLRPSTLENYVFRVSKYFEFCHDQEPSPEMAQKFGFFDKFKGTENYRKMQGAVVAPLCIHLFSTMGWIFRFHPLLVTSGCSAT